MNVQNLDNQNWDLSEIRTLGSPDFGASLASQNIICSAIFATLQNYPQTCFNWFTCKFFPYILQLFGNTATL